MTWAVLRGLWGNQYFRYAVYSAIVLAALYATALHFEHVGAVQAHSDDAQRTADAIEKMHKSDRAEFTEQLKPLIAAADEARKQATEAHQLALSIIAQRQAVTNQVASMSDKQIDDAVGRKVGDLNLPEVKRQILACHEQLPLCEQQAKADAAEAAHSKVDADRSRDALQKFSGYVEAIERNYSALWNAKATSERSWRCAKLWRCRRKQIEAPAPLEVMKNRPALQTSAIQSGVTK